VAAYRDETETLRARVAELERELTTLREAAAPRPLDRAWSGLEARILGAPTALVEERVLEAPLDDTLLEEILDVLRARLGTVGTVARTTSKGSVIWQCGPPAKQRIVEVTLKPDGARTHLRIVERIGQLAGGLFGGIVGGLGGGVGLGLEVPLLIEAHRPWLLAITVPSTVLAVWLAVRAAFVLAARRRQVDLAALAVEITGVASGRSAPKTRVESEDERDDDGASENERDARRSAR
jgi:hypothetical protein